MISSDRFLRGRVDGVFDDVSSSSGVVIVSVIVVGGCGLFRGWIVWCCGILSSIEMMMMLLM